MANDQQKLAMTQPSTTTPDPFAIAYLQLCEVSYFDFAEIAAGVAALRPLDATGSWQCVWGPAENHDNADPVFVAAYTMAAGLPPTFAAVANRRAVTDVNDALGRGEYHWVDLH